jgi:hypothetical protein
MTFTMTHRNLINLAFIVAFATCAIFTFNLSKVQYVGLYLFLLVAPKTFWVSYEPLRKWFSHSKPLRFRHRRAA